MRIWQVKPASPDTSCSSQYYYHKLCLNLLPVRLLAALQAWNLGHLESVLSSTMEKHGVVIPGVNSTYLYVGSWRSTFAW